MKNDKSLGFRNHVMEGAVESACGILFSKKYFKGVKT